MCVCVCAGAPCIDNQTPIPHTPEIKKQNKKKVVEPVEAGSMSIITGVWLQEQSADDPPSPPSPLLPTTCWKVEGTLAAC